MGAGSPDLKTGLSISHYSFGVNMSDHKISMYTSDGDMLIVPQIGVLHVTTEFGKLRVAPKEVVIIQRGMKFSVDLATGEFAGRGWIAECFKGHFVIPDLGPIGSNGLANERDFSSPVAAYEQTSERWTVVNRFMGKTFSYT